MTSRTQSGDVKPISAGTARRLSAPPASKTLPQTPDQPAADVQPEDAALPLPPHLLLHSDQHIHSLGYGIDE